MFERSGGRINFTSQIVQTSEMKKAQPTPLRNTCINCSVGSFHTLRRLSLMRERSGKRSSLIRRFANFHIFDDLLILSCWLLSKDKGLLRQNLNVVDMIAPQDLNRAANEKQIHSIPFKRYFLDNSGHLSSVAITSHPVPLTSYHQPLPPCNVQPTSRSASCTTVAASLPQLIDPAE